MISQFADTSFYVSLANPRDLNHARALVLADTTHGRIVTTDYVLVELGNWFSRTGDRAAFHALLAQIDGDEDTYVVSGTHALLARGVMLYRSRPDKSWSLTDCISFVVMEEHGIAQALTADHHFEQAGFTILLK